MTDDQLESLEITALKVREHIIRMSSGGGCFIGASLSCVEILVYLYKEYLNIDKAQLQNPERNYFSCQKATMCLHFMAF